MKPWKKALRRASQVDQASIAQAVIKLRERIFPPDTIKLQGKDFYRTRVGDWRIQFHFEEDLLRVDSITRRGEHTYKRHG